MHLRFACPIGGLFSFPVCFCPMQSVFILLVVAVAILAIYFLLNRKVSEVEREGTVKDVLKKDVLVLDFGDQRPVVVKVFGITPSSEAEMLDDKVFAFYDEFVRGTRVLVRSKRVDPGEVMVAELRTQAGEYINAVLVRHGFARWSVSEAPEDSQLADAQELAKSEQLGVWNPAVRQLAEEKRRQAASEALSDDDIANMSVDPEADRDREGGDSQV